MKKKRKKRKFKFRHALILFLVIYIALIYYNQSKMLSELQAKKQVEIKEIEELESEIKELNREISNSDSLEFIEKIAREDLGMVKPREIIYIDKGKEKESVFKEDLKTDK